MNTDYEHTRAELLVILTDRLKGETLQDVALTNNGYYRFDFPSGRLYVPTGAVTLIEDKEIKYQSPFYSS